MQKIKFKDFQIIPDFNSVHREAISDEEYFSAKYAKCISNSRLKWIDPTDGGSPALFQSPPRLRTTSLSRGSAVHQCVLEPEEFELIDKIGKPTAKLGEMMDSIEYYLVNDDTLSVEDAIRKASIKVDYYQSSIESKIESVKSTWETYSKKLSEVRAKKTNKEQIILSDNDWDVVSACIKSFQENEAVMNKLHPKNVFGDPIESHCEDALFMDFIVIYKQTQCCTLRFKLKIDNWTIDFDNKVVTLNDLKTSGKSCNIFMKPEGSFNHFHYYRQFGVYSTILWYYCMKKYGVTKEQGWKLDCNVCVVETIPNYWSRCYTVSDAQLKRGTRELNELLKRVAYYEIFGYENEVEFE